MVIEFKPVGRTTQSPQAVASEIVSKLFKDNNLNAAYQQHCVDAVGLLLVARTAAGVFDTSDLYRQQEQRLTDGIALATGESQGQIVTFTQDHRTPAILGDFRRAIANTVTKAKERAKAESQNIP